MLRKKVNMRLFIDILFMVENILVAVEEVVVVEVSVDVCVVVLLVREEESSSFLAVVELLDG